MSNDSQSPDGLGSRPKEEWPVAPPEGIPAIELLKPGSEIHKRVLTYLLDRLNSSERKMSSFYARWEYNEKRMQA